MSRNAYLIMQNPAGHAEVITGAYVIEKLLNDDLVFSENLIKAI
jgi:hypothetical protein